jgi:hypothetical protein
MERHSRLGRSSKRNRFCRANIPGLIALLSAVCVAAVTAQEPKEQQRPDNSVRASIHNVKYRFAENVSIQINDLSGALVPLGDHAMPVLGDKESFKIRIDAAEIAISPQDLANLLNQFVFAQSASQLAGVSVTTLSQGHLKVKGRLKDKGNIPFESEGALVPMPDGRLRLTAQKVKALKIPVKGLMDAFGIEVDNLIQSGKVPGVAADGNDLIFNLEQMLPAPHIEGRVIKVRLEPNTIVQTFGSDGTNKYVKPMPKFSGNYMALQGNKVQIGKLMMDDCDIVVQDMDPSDPLDFFLDRYKEQIAAGYTKISTSFQVRAYIKDYQRLVTKKALAIAPAKK